MFDYRIINIENNYEYIGGVIINKALPIFLKGLDSEENCQAGFRKDFNLDTLPGNIQLRITGRTFYRVFLNGEFLFHGPARSAHNYMRVDTLDITDKVIIGLNKLAVEIAGYNEKNLYVTGESSFLLSEVKADGEIIAATDNTWGGIRLSQRRQNVELYSHARCANEIYDLDESYFEWKTGPFENLPLLTVEEVKININLLERGVPHPDLNIENKAKLLSISKVDRMVNKQVPGFAALETKEYTDELLRKGVERPSVECYQEIDTGFDGSVEYSGHADNEIGLRIKSPSKVTAVEFDFGRPASAFLGMEFEGSSNSVIDLIHAERLNSDGSVDPRSGSCNNVVRLHCKAGRFVFESFEPYCVRFLRVVVRGTDEFIIHKVFLRNYQYKNSLRGTFICNDGELNRIYEASDLTLRLSTLDVFMDCPSRERAGWLCDSFWSARAERMIFGDSMASRTMLENFLLSPDKPVLKGFFPQCYPAGDMDAFIPNWAMFLVLQLYEYFQMSGDKDFVKRYKNRIKDFLKTLEKYENKDGLLEDLPGNVFIEWSSANRPEYIRPISIPTNALYAKMLEYAGELYHYKELKGKAAYIREKIRSNALRHDGFYSDSIKYGKEGKLEEGGFSSEAAQYYCFWLDVAGGESDRDLGKILMEEYGPYPEKYNSNLQVARANVFIGFYIRFECLAMWNAHTKLLTEMKRMFSYMIENGPGTLWEHLSYEGSVCHGFASHAGVWLMRDYLGLGIPDAVNKRIIIAPHPCGLKWAKGSINTEEGVSSLNWSLDDNTFHLTANIPNGYYAELEIPSEIVGWKSITINKKRLPFGTENIAGLAGALTLCAKKS